MPMEVFSQSERGRQALFYVDQARRKIENGEDAIPDLDTAIAVLRVEVGGLPESEIDIELRPS